MRTMASPKMIGGGRAVRVCDLCGGVDDHPRHVIAGGADAFATPDPDLVQTVLDNAEAAGVGDLKGRLVRDLMSTAAQDRHMDCCRAAGCPTGACDAQTAGAEAKVGKALLTHLVALPQNVVTEAERITREAAR